MASNPNTVKIPQAMWEFWQAFQAIEPTAVLSGIYANKPGYHNSRNALSTRDYSIADVAADRLGPSGLAAGLDISMPESAMKKYTSRLDKAARNRDTRLYLPKQPPIIREFIGTLNGKTVYCYMLTGGIPQGVGADAGPDWDRDSSHLWHLHLSFIRAQLNNKAGYNGLLSVMKGEPAQKGPTVADDLLNWSDKIKFITDKQVTYAQPDTRLDSYFSSLHYYTVLARNNALDSFLNTAKILEQLNKPHSLSDADVQRIADAVYDKFTSAGWSPPSKP